MPTSVNISGALYPDRVRAVIADTSVRYDSSQSLSAAQKAQALANLGANADLTITQAISDGVTEQAPSADAVFDALSGKASTSLSNTTSTGIIIDRTLTLTANTTFAFPVCIVGNGSINCAGYNVVFNGGLEAPVRKVFTNPGTITFGLGVQKYCHVEWWASSGVNADGDCIAAFEAARDSGCKCIRLLESTYWISRTLKLNVDGLTVIGTGSLWEGDGTCSRIMGTSPTGDVVYMGSDTFVSVESMVTSLALIGVEVNRLPAPTPPSIGDEISAPTGVRMRYARNAYICDVRSSEHCVPFYIDGAIASLIEDSYAFRSVSSTTSTNNIFWGFAFNGDRNIGFAGGNASIRVVRCHSGVGNHETINLSESIGFNIYGRYSDTFIIDCETANNWVGVKLSGVYGSSEEAQEAGNVDVFIDHLVADQCREYGITVQNMALGGTVNISRCYVANAANASSLAAYHILNNNGALSLTDNEAVNYGSNPNNTYGILAIDSSYIRAVGNRLQGCAGPEALVRVSHSRFEDIIRNPYADAKGSQAATHVTGPAARLFLASIISGVSGAFPQAVYMVGTDVTYSEVNLTGVDPGCIIGGATNKLQYNATSITSAGTFGSTNLASGVMS